MEHSDILKTPEHQKLSELEEQRAQLQVMFTQASLPEIKAAYEVAMSQLDVLIATHARSSFLQNGYATYGAEGLDGLEQISPLEGVLSTDQLKPLQDNLEIRIQAAKDFFERYGTHTPEALEFIQRTGSGLAVASTVEITPVGQDSNTEQANGKETLMPGFSPETAETAKQSITLRVRGNAIQIGKQGKIIPLSGRSNQKQQDYSETRLAALKILIDNQDRQVGAREIWEKIETPTTRNTTSSRAALRTWLSGLTYRSQQLVISNGKRGSGAKYWVAPGFSINLQEETLTKNVAYTAEKLPLELGDLYIAARHLEQFNPILKGHGVAEIDSKLIKGLSRYEPDNGHIKGDSQAIWASRQQAFERISGLFDDDDSFFSFLGSSDEKSSEYQMVEYLFGLDEDQRDLVKKLMRARIEREVISENQIRFWAVSIDGREDIVAYTDVIRREPSALTELVEDDAGKKDDHATSDDSEHVSTTPVSEGTVTVDGIKKAVVETRPRFSAQERQKLDEIRTRTHAILDIYLASPLGNDVSRRYKLNQVQGVIPAFNSKAVREALEASLMTRDGRKQLSFTAKDVVRILLFNNTKTQGIFRTRKYQKEIDKIIDELIAQKTNEKAIRE